MCEYCEEDYDGWYKPLDKNGHVCVFDTPHEKRIDVTYYGNRLRIDINYCPMCGRNLREEKKDA